LRAELLRSWGRAAADPGSEICDWLVHGAGAGVKVDPSEAGKVFPPADPGDEPENFDTEEIVLTSRACDDDDAMKQIFDYEAKGWIERFTREQLQERFGQDFVVSNFCVLEKKGGKKKRLIMDLKQSGMSARTRKTHRVVLPRISDAVQDALLLASTAAPSDEFEFLVLDFTDAFWHVPLHPDERRYFIGFDGVRYWGYLRAAQGSRNGPLAWAGPSALLARCTQGLLSGSSSSTAPPPGEGYNYMSTTPV